MKKLSKKQKLIIFIAILLIAVILAIVITTNIINNGQVASERYSATTANANSNLVAGYIKEGITIGGITGTLESLNTFDATATPEDIIWGKTGYVKGEKITGTKVVTVAQGKASQKAFEENTTLIDDYGNRVKVPAGFKIAEDSATSVTGGVVIEDVTAKGATEYTKGSQFVWVPVGDVKTDNLGNSTNITLGRYLFEEDGKENLIQSADDYANETNLPDQITSGYYYQELLNSTNSNNVKAYDIADFILKTKSAGGYFIGRYEMGDAMAINSAKEGIENQSNPSNPVTCKSGVYPYTFISQGDAANLSRNMYSDDTYKSDLINSYAWDTALVFIQNFSGDKSYSRKKAFQNTLAKCGETTDGNNKDVRCNIYDMASNTIEWTTETHSGKEDYNYPCTDRGGAFFRDDSYSCYRYNDAVGQCEIGISFRTILYL